MVTGTRAEFGLLRPVVDAMLAKKRLRVSLVVSGAHFVTGTWREIERSGYAIAGKVRMQKKGEAGMAADAAALGRGVSGFTKVFSQLRPDVVMVLGDRIEAFAAASAAAIGGQHVAHIHGGDRAEGVADESMRHAISKLAHIHFPASKASMQRLIRMGEERARVYCVGSPAVDGLEGLVGEVAEQPRVIVLQHPVGEADKREQAWMLGTLKGVARYVKGHAGEGGVLVLEPNVDAGRDGVIRGIEIFQQACQKQSAGKGGVASGQKKVGRGVGAAAADQVDGGVHGGRGLQKEWGWRFVSHVPRKEFVSLVAGALMVVGNSSAGLIEAAALKTPAVNIGPRQNGREKPKSVVDCDYGEVAVAAAMQRAAELRLRRMKHPYGDGTAGKQIAKVLGGLNLRKVSLRKQNTY